MQDYSKLIQALRYCVSGDCKNCSYFDKCKENGTAMDQLHNDAAAAIEELQAEVEKLKSYLQTAEEVADHYEEKAARLEPKRGKWFEDYGTAKCSICDKEFMFKYTYCPSCGAKMEVQDGQK